MEYDFPDDMEEIVKPFNPFTFQIQPLEVSFKIFPIEFL